MKFPSFRKKKENTRAEAQITVDEAKDFSFVQLDKSIHDTKFETKPTTYFKDAFKRFCKSKSSVTAAVILGVLIIMAAIVPYADGNSITQNNTLTRFLPPKWFDSYNGGFMDGTSYIEGATIDPETMLPAAEPGTGNLEYIEAGIMNGIEGITYREETYNNLSSTVTAYGHGGDATFYPNSYNTDLGFYSPTALFDLSVSNEFSYELDVEKCLDDSLSGDVIFAPYFFEVDGTTVTPLVALTDFSQDYSAKTFDISPLVREVLEESGRSETSIRGAVGFRTLGEVETRQTIFVTKASLTQNGVLNETISFDDATQMLGSTTNNWRVQGNGQANIHGSIVTVGDFVYDYYAAANSDDVWEGVTYSQVQDMVNRGWITYEWQNSTGAPGEFHLTELGETYSPIRSVISENYSSWNGATSQSLTVVRSRYRYYYYMGYTAECTPVKYFFGTNNQGQDFFKIVFSGLLTSLELGLLATIINVTIGLIWGSISGYFGGWIDLFMERITEILGGMPFVVLMTLIVLLLGSNFWTFLLALCLTGWIGVSSTTRSQFYRFKRREYVLASRTLGASDGRLIFRHILPNGVGTIVTSAVLMIPSVIFSEATISYILPGALAFQGGQSFGVTLSTAQDYIQNYPYMIVAASIVMIIIMICFNLFGNGLRDALNPSMKGAQD